MVIIFKKIKSQQKKYAEIAKEEAEAIADKLKRNNFNNFVIFTFGSCNTEEANETSDIDMVILLEQQVLQVLKKYEKKISGKKLESILGDTEKTEDESTDKKNIINKWLTDYDHFEHGFLPDEDENFDRWGSLAKTYRIQRIVSTAKYLCGNEAIFNNILKKFTNTYAKVPSYEGKELSIICFRNILKGLSKNDNVLIAKNVLRLIDAYLLSCGPKYEEHLSIKNKNNAYESAYELGTRILSDYKDLFEWAKDVKLHNREFKMSDEIFDQLIKFCKDVKEKIEENSKNQNIKIWNIFDWIEITYSGVQNLVSKLQKKSALDFAAHIFIDDFIEYGFMRNAIKEQQISQDLKTILEKFEKVLEKERSYEIEIKLSFIGNLLNSLNQKLNKEDDLIMPQLPQNNNDNFIVKKYNEIVAKNYFLLYKNIRDQTVKQKIIKHYKEAICSDPLDIKLWSDFISILSILEENSAAQKYYLIYQILTNEKSIRKSVFELSNAESQIINEEFHNGKNLENIFWKAYSNDSSVENFCLKEKPKSLMIFPIYKYSKLISTLPVLENTKISSDGYKPRNVDFENKIRCLKEEISDEVTRYKTKELGEKIEQKKIRIKHFCDTIEQKKALLLDLNFRNWFNSFRDTLIDLEKKLDNFVNGLGRTNKILPPLDSDYNSLKSTLNDYKDRLSEVINKIFAEYLDFLEFDSKAQIFEEELKDEILHPSFLNELSKYDQNSIENFPHTHIFAKFWNSFLERCEEIYEVFQNLDPNFANYIIEVAYNSHKNFASFLEKAIYLDIIQKKMATKQGEENFSQKLNFLAKLDEKIDEILSSSEISRSSLEEIYSGLRITETLEDESKIENNIDFLKYLMVEYKNCLLNTYKTFTNKTIEKLMEVQNE
jgi:predicted nucleotidyltransferase